jgi:DNA-binding NtrC family response regulator
LNPPDELKCVENARVLVVEDEYLIAAYIDDILKSGGAREVLLVDRVSEAFKALALSGPIDFAVLDVHIRGTSSESLATVLWEKGIPFVFATGASSALVVPESLRAVPAVEKPFTADGLLKALARAKLELRR